MNFYQSATWSSNILEDSFRVRLILIIRADEVRKDVFLHSWETKRA